jgi:general secretion pathway protein G
MLSRARSLLLVSLVGLVLAAPAWAADNAGPTHEELLAQVQELQLQVKQALAAAKDDQQRFMAQIQALQAVIEQQKKALQEAVDRHMADKAKWLAEADRLRKGLPAGPAAEPKAEDLKVPAGHVLVTLPVAPGAVVKPGDVVDVRGAFPAPPEYRPKNLTRTVLAGARVVAVNGSAAAPAADAKIETVQVILPKDDAAKLPQIVKLLDGKFTIALAPVARLTPEARDLAAKLNPEAAKKANDDARAEALKNLGALDEAVKAFGAEVNQRLAAAKADITALGMALDAFEVDCGRYPTAAEGLQALVAQPAGGVKGWGGPYLKALPKDPWGNAFKYVCPGVHNPQGYDLSSLGPDGKDGTPDDIGNWDKK